MKPEISIITINLNNASGLRRTLESIADQSYGNFESIVIDGQSVDSSVEVIQEYIALGRPQVFHWISEADSGIYQAQNKGVRFASGRYLLFLNSGDYLTGPNILEKLDPKNWTADLVYGHIKVVGESESYESKAPAQITIKHMLLSTLNHPATFISRQLFDRVGPYWEDYKICADYHFFLDAIYNHSATTDFRNETISVFPLGGISSSKKYLDIHISERRRAQKEVLLREILDLVDELRQMENRMNSLKFAILAIPRFLRRQLAKRRNQW